MKFLLFLAAGLSMAGLVSAQDSVVIADFENDQGEFGKDLIPDDTVAHGGKTSGKIEADLTAVTQSAWVTAKRSLEDMNIEKFESLRFWVKTSDASQLTVRVTDSTGQHHQVRPQLQADGGWQEIVIESFEAGPGHQSYGGAGDKEIHWPVRSLSFILEKNGLPTGAGAVWIDDVTATVAK